MRLRFRVTSVAFASATARKLFYGRSRGFQLQLLNALGRTFWLHVVSIEPDFSLLIDDHDPRRSARAVLAHDLRSPYIACALAKRNFQGVAIGHRFKFVSRVDSMAFKCGLNRNKSNVRITVEFLGQRLKRWKSGTVAAGAPRLEKIQIRHFASVISDINRLFSIWQLMPRRNAPFGCWLANDTRFLFFLRLRGG